MSSVSIIIPAYNEEITLPALLERLCGLSAQHSWEIVVVDDGSIDKTYDVARSFPIRLVRLMQNRGYGAALKKGMREASNDILVFLDGDGQHNPEDVFSLIQPMDAYDMVIGCRDSQKTPRQRKIGKWILSCVSNYLAGTRIPDVNSGFRAVKRHLALEFMSLYPNGFSLSTTLTLAMCKAAYNIKYVPIDILPRQGGKSMVRQGKDGAITVLLILRCVMLFNPLKVFIPCAVIVLLVGGMFSAYGLVAYHKVSNSAIIMILSGLMIFFFGLMADQISLVRRSK